MPYCKNLIPQRKTLSFIIHINREPSGKHSTTLRSKFIQHTFLGYLCVHVHACVVVWYPCFKGYILVASLFLPVVCPCKVIHILNVYINSNVHMPPNIVCDFMWISLHASLEIFFETICDQVSKIHI